MHPKLIDLQLFKFEAVNTASFYCMEEKPSVLENGKAIVFLHGLGENKSGLNYLFHELSQGLVEVGYSVYRFDLGGCGESELPLSLDIWKKQLASLQNFLKEKYHQIHLIARGAASLLLPKVDNPAHIAIGPVIEDFFLAHCSLVEVEEEQENWTPKVEQQTTQARECFWAMLGVEAGCLGGFSISKQFLEEMRSNVGPVYKSWKVIFAGEMPPLATPQVNLYHFPHCHPLFFHHEDRVELLKQIIEILKNETNAV